MSETTTAVPETTTKKERKLTDYTIKTILLRAELVITGHQSDTEIQSAMAPFSYTAEVMEQLSTKLANTRAVVVATTQSRGAQKGHTQQVQVAWDVARDACATLALVAREVLKGDPAALTALGLTGGRAPQALAPFLLYADLLFAGALNAPPAIKDALATRGYHEARLTAEKAKIEALHTTNQAQEQAKGTAQNLTPQQRQTLDELDAAIMTYRKLARRALKRQPALLAKLGITSVS